MSNVFILFGATGDLSREKIIPALFSTYKNKSIKDLSIIAVSRRDYSDEDFRNFVLREAKLPKASKKDLQNFLNIISYVSGTFETKDLYAKLSENIKKDSRVVTYLAIAPHFFRDVIRFGARSGVWNRGVSHKILLEKPYAENVSGIKNLEKIVAQYVPKQALFVDHYLGKQPLIDIVKLRRQNKNLEARLQNNISRIVVRIFENNNVDRRGEFYDKTGAFVDVGANHMMQMLASIAAPLLKNRINAQKFFESLYLDKTCSIPMQYSGYHEIRGVVSGTVTETGFEMFLHSRLPHLKDVDILLAGGKAFDSFQSDITVLFTDGTHMRIGLKPKESIIAKGLGIRQIYKKAQDAYETIIEDAFSKKTQYFVDLAEIHEEWRIIKDVQRCSRGKNPKTYQRGTQVPTYDTTDPIWDML